MNGPLVVFLVMDQEKDIVTEFVFQELIMLVARMLLVLEMIKKVKIVMILLAMLYIVHLDINTALGMLPLSFFSDMVILMTQIYIFFSFRQTCYYLGSELTSSAGAAVSCAVKYGGRPAVFMKREELNEIKLKISSMPKAWIGKN